MKTVKVCVGECQTDCYIIFDGSDAMLIDPGDEPEVIEQSLDGADVKCIVLTHGHLDHVYEAPYFAEKYSAPVYIGENDAEYLENRSLCIPFNIFPWAKDKKYNVSGLLKDGQTFTFGSLEFEVMTLPGHTKGGIALLCDGELFCGDVLFRDSVGRTDFPGSDEGEMRKSLTRLMALPDETLVHPGHGADTTIGYEKKNNFFIKMFLRR